MIADVAGLWGEAGHVARRLRNAQVPGAPDVGALNRPLEEWTFPCPAQSSGSS